MMRDEKRAFVGWRCQVDMVRYPSGGGEGIDVELCGEEVGPAQEVKNSPAGCGAD